MIAMQATASAYSIAGLAASQGKRASSRLCARLKPAVSERQTVSRTVVPGAYGISRKAVAARRTPVSVSASSEEQPTLESLIVDKNNENTVMIYSKTYCP